MQIEFATLPCRLRAAIVASVNTRATDHNDGPLWGAALTLEGGAYDRLTLAEQDWLYSLDRTLTALENAASHDIPTKHRARYVGRLLACLA